jgi:hypothetical protein
MTPIDDRPPDFNIEPSFSTTVGRPPTYETAAFFLDSESILLTHHGLSGGGLTFLILFFVREK